MRSLLIILSLAVNFGLWSKLREERDALSRTQSELQTAQAREKRATEAAGLRAGVLVEAARQGSAEASAPRRWLDARLDSAGKSLDMSASLAAPPAASGRSHSRR